ncbi:MAG: RNA polymerase sigma-70 factor [Marinilabiliaceae bacterium]|nr:RNA polymerase sigma-70 factor [Marinilabiliaceae bacterium]
MPNDFMDDLSIIKGLAKGSKKAFEELFKKYYSLLVVFASKFVNDIDTAREIVQDTFVHFYEKRNEIKIHTSLKAHLFQSVKNRALNYIKRDSIIKNHHLQIESDLKDSILVTDDEIEVSELQQRIYQAVNSLPDRCSEIFKMSRFDGLTNNEIAESLSLSKRTVETQISKALRIIREKLHDYSAIVVVGLFIVAVFFGVINKF